MFWPDYGLVSTQVSSPSSSSSSLPSGAERVIANLKSKRSILFAHNNLLRLVSISHLWSRCRRDCPRFQPHRQCIHHSYSTSCPSRSRRTSLSATRCPTDLPHLNASVLKLNISSMRLSPTALHHIVSYLSSPAAAASRPPAAALTWSALLASKPSSQDIFSNQGHTEDVDSPESLSEWRTTYALLQCVLTHR